MDDYCPFSFWQMYRFQKKLTDYQRGHAAAKPFGQSWTITGRVKNIFSFTRTKSVHLKPARWTRYGVWCHFNDDESYDLLKLFRMDQVQIRGKIKGIGEDAVVMEECVVLETPETKGWERTKNPIPGKTE